MIEVRQTDLFATWLNNLGDQSARQRIQIRLRRVSLGNFGDVKAVGGGVRELRIDYGPGYRVYFTQRGNVIVILLVGEPSRPSKPTSQKQSRLLRSGAMPVKTTKWDPAEYLDSPNAIIAYLEAAFDDGDPALIAAALGDIARAKGMTQLALEAGVTREALYKALSPTGDPRLSTLLGVMKALGIKLKPRAA